MLAKRIFYVSASILALAIAYQLGVTTAVGQSGGPLAAANDPGMGSYAVTSSGAVYLSDYGSLTPVAPHWTFKGTIPAVAPIIDIESAGTDNAGNAIAHAFDSAGNFYLSSNNGVTWSRRGNVFGTPVPAQQQSWSQVKARYRSNPISNTRGAIDR